MFGGSQKDNIKLKGLDGQMSELDQDFQNMLRAREEARRKLEERFRDVYARIKANKDYMIESGKEFNEKLKVYQSEYSDEIENTKEKLQNDLSREQQVVEGILRQTDDRMQRLEQEIQKEKDERREDWNKQLSDIDRRYKAVKQGFSDETKNRISKKKNVLNAMAEGNAKIMQWLEEERSERQKQRDTLKNDIEKAVKSIDQRFLNFQKDTRFQFDEHREGHENSLLEEWGKKIDLMEAKIKGISENTAFAGMKQ